MVANGGKRFGSETYTAAMGVSVVDVVDGVRREIRFARTVAEAGELRTSN